MRRVSTRAGVVLTAELLGALACGPSRSPATDASALGRANPMASSSSLGSSHAYAESAEVRDACRSDPGPPLSSGIGSIDRLVSGTWHLCPGTGHQLIAGLNLMPDVKGLSLTVHPRDPMRTDVFEGRWGTIAAPGGELVELPPGCGRRSARGPLTVTRDVLETETRTEVSTGESGPSPVGLPGPPPPQGEELERLRRERALARARSPGPIPERTLPGDLVTFTFLKRWQLRAEAQAEGFARSSIAVPVSVWDHAGHLMVGDAKFVRLDRARVGTIPPLPSGVTPSARAPSRYDDVASLIALSPEVVLRGNRVDQCRPYRPRTLKKYYGDECRIELEVERVLGGPPQWSGRKLVARDFAPRFAWAKNPNARVLARLDRGERGLWLGPSDVIDDPEMVKLAEQIGAGFSPDRPVPDLTRELGPHPRLKDFQNAPGLALVSPLSAWYDDRSDDGCLQTMRVKVHHVLRGSLRQEPHVKLRVPDEALRPSGPVLVEYRDEAAGPVLVRSFLPWADSLVVAAMATAAPLPARVMREHGQGQQPWTEWCRRHSSPEVVGTNPLADAIRRRAKP